MTSPSAAADIADALLLTRVDLQDELACMLVLIQWPFLCREITAHLADAMGLAQLMRREWQRRGAA